MYINNKVNNISWGIFMLYLDFLNDNFCVDIL